MEIIIGVINEKLANITVPQGEGQAAGPAPISEVEAIIVVPVWRTIPEVETRIVTLEAARMVVDYIEDHGDTVQMTEVDHGLELMGATAEVIERERGLLLGREQSIHRHERGRQGGLFVNDVAEVGREVVGAVVSQCGFGRGCSTLMPSACRYSILSITSRKVEPAPGVRGA